MLRPQLRAPALGEHDDGPKWDYFLERKQSLDQGLQKLVEECDSHGPLPMLVANDEFREVYRRAMEKRGDR